MAEKVQDQFIEDPYGGPPLSFPMEWSDDKIQTWMMQNRPNAYNQQTGEYLGKIAPETDVYVGTAEPEPQPTNAAPQTVKGAASELVTRGLPLAASALAVGIMPEVTPALAGAGLLSRMAVPAANTALRMGAAGAGMASGAEAADQFVYGQTRPPEDYSGEVLAGALGEGVASAALGAAGAAYRPMARWAKGFNEETKMLSRTAGEMGIPVTEGMLGKGFASKAAQGLTNYSPVGQFFLKQRAGKLQEATNKWSRDFVDDFGLSLPYSPGSKLETGLGAGKIFEGIDDAKQYYDLMGKEIKNFAEANGGVVGLPETTAFLQKVRNGIVAKNPAMTSSQLDNATISYLGFRPADDVAKKTIKPLMRGEAIDPGNAIDLSTRVYPRKSPEFEKMTPVTRDLRGSLKESVLADYSGMGNSEVIKRKADEIRKFSREFFKENPTARRISKAYGKDPEQMVNTFWSATPEEIVRMRDALLMQEGGPQVWAGLRFQAVKDLFDGAIGFEKMTGKEVFDPGKFLRNWDNALPRMEAAAPYAVKQLQPYVDTLRASAPYFTGPSSQLSNATLAAQGLTFLAPKIMIGYNALGAMAAWATLGAGERGFLRSVMAGAGKASARAGAQYKFSSMLAPSEAENGR